MESKIMPNTRAELISAILNSNNSVRVVTIDYKDNDKFYRISSSQHLTAQALRAIINGGCCINIIEKYPLDEECEEIGVEWNTHQLLTVSIETLKTVKDILYPDYEFLLP